MVRIREILALEALSGFELLAGAGGLDNALTNVTILDYETDNMDFSAFQKGDFILTSLFFAKDAPQLIVDAFRELLRRGISGIAVKTVFYKTLPADMLRLANAMKVPVFTYHAASMEDIILSAHSYMLAKEQRELAAMRLDAMLGIGRIPSAIAESVRALDAMLYPHCVAAFGTPKDGSVPGPGQEIPTSSFSGGQYSAFFPYHGGLLQLFTTADAGQLATSKDAILQIFTKRGAEPDAWQIGISAPCDTYDSYDTAIRQSLYANRVCRCFEKPCLDYSELGVFRFLPALLENKSALAEYRAALECLRFFEQESGIPLLRTLSAYVSAHGSVEQAAKQVYQHPNTVRNHVKKACSLLGLTESCYEQLFLLMGMYALEQV